MDDKVSIIIPVYNSENYIDRCIKSAVNQTYSNIEIIVVDDGSIDKSGEICDKYASKDYRIKVIHKENSGVSNSRNIGISKANGEYIFFMDSDDYIDCNVIEESIKNIEKDCIVKVSGRTIGHRKKSENRMKGCFIKERYISKIISGVYGGHCWGYLIPRKTIECIWFDESTSCMEDTLFMIECILKVNTIKCIDTTFYNHTINPNGITGSSDRVEKNIKDYCYSIDYISELLNNCSIKNEELLNRKKMKIIEAETGKLNKYDCCKNIVCSDVVTGNISNIKNHITIPGKYRFYTYIILNRKFRLLFLYNKIRYLLKKLI